MDWLPSVTTTALLAAALWLSRKVIATRLANGVRHEFDVKLEKVRAEIRAGEEHLNAVRATALQGVSSGTTALIQRRLQATDLLWKAVTTMKQGGMVAQMVGALNVEKVEANRNQTGVETLLKFLEQMGDQFIANAKATVPEGAESARPYVTPMAWALYSAYTGIVMDAVITVKALRLGTPIGVLNPEFALDLVKAALPDAHALLEKFGRGALPKLLGELEERLLAELRASVEGRDWDTESAARARKVAELLAAREVADARKGAGV